MSIWTSRANTAALMLTALVTACGGVGPLRNLRSQGPPPMRQIAVTSDQIIVTGPQGFCVDPTSTDDRVDTAFVLMGNCAVISNRRNEAQPQVQAVLTASVSEADLGTTLRESIPEMDRFFQSEDGRQLLSRAGDADSVEILDSFFQGDVYFLHARDTSASEIADVTEVYWRSYLDVGPRIATLTVLETEATAIGAEDSLATLQDFTNAVIAANTGADQPPLAALPPAARVVQPAAPPQTSDGTLWNVGLFRRIMTR
jgi:hypothetical protein